MSVMIAESEAETDALDTSSSASLERIQTWRVYFRVRRWNERCRLLWLTLLKSAEASSLLFATWNLAAGQPQDFRK